MKREYVIILIAWLAGAGICHAQPVAEAKAVEIAVSFFNERVSDSRPLAGINNSKTAVQAHVWKQRERNCMYAVNMPDSGWVLVSGDERAEPILAFSKSDKFPSEEDMPPAMLDLLRDYADEIMFIQDSCPKAAAHSNWQNIKNRNYSSMRLRNNGGGSGIYTPGNGLLNRPDRGEVLWNQNQKYTNDDCDKTYNKFCPAWHAPSCGRTYAGCVAVAMAQIMWYWQWPHTGMIPADVEQDGDPVGGTVLRLYDWNLMPVELNNNTPMDQVNMVAGFLRDCGYAAETEYGAAGSSASIQNAKAALEETFAYTVDDLKRKFWTPNWASKLRDEINAGRPVFYLGHGSGGHGGWIPCGKSG